MNVELPELTGTEKQVAWALQIRGDLLKYWDRQIEMRERNVGLRPGPKSGDPAAQWWLDTQRPALEAWLLSEVLVKAEAKWWIDNRNHLWDGVPEEITRQRFSR